MLAQSISKDIFRRFTPTALGGDFTVMGKRLRLETNSPEVLAHTRQALSHYQDAEAETVGFHWSLVSDPTSGLRPPLSTRTAFSDAGLRFINFDQRAFLAIDLGKREAVGFLSQELCEDEMGFYSRFLSDLFDMTAPALGLTEVMAGCVSLNDRGLLVFGAPRSGKTTAGYLAGKMGMEFLADQVTCLELSSGDLRAWGQFWPPAFRTESLEFLPEIESVSRPFRYRDISLLCLDKGWMQPAQAHSVAPRVCVFLERCGAETAQLTRLSKEEVTSLLFSSLPFVEDRCFEPQRREVVLSLAELPAHHLAYAADPRAAAALFPTLLGE
jgi:hypothetical protein